jgi:L-fuconolactonase
MNRRDFLSLTLSASVASNLPRTALAQEASAKLDVIDCHTHFYDPTRPGGVPWPPKESSIYRPVLPHHLRELPHYRKVTGTVIVEASRRLEDNQWLLDISKNDPLVVGIVGNVSPEDPDFEKSIRRFAAHPLFRGIRVSLAMVNQRLESGDLQPFRLLAELGLMLDINGGPETPASVAKLAAGLPKLQCVINHMGNVPITPQTPPQDWASGMAAAARQPNVACKLSAFMVAASKAQKKAPEDLPFYTPYFDVIWNAFGEDRVIYGSDWPNSEPYGSYAAQQRLSFEYVASKGPGALQKFTSLNAKKVYGWIERPGRNP